MTRNELDQWISAAKYIDGQGEYDEPGNYEEFRIYKKDGKYFRLYFQNNHPCSRWEGMKRIPGDYLPKEVERKVEMVEEVTYHSKDGLSD